MSSMRPVSIERWAFVALPFFIVGSSCLQLLSDQSLGGRFPKGSPKKAEGGQKTHIARSFASQFVETIFRNLNLKGMGWVAWFPAFESHVFEKIGRKTCSLAR